MLFRIAACAALLASAGARNIVRQNSASTDTTITTTVTEGETSTVTDTTTLFKTVFSTIVVTKTDITTATETKKDVATATSVIYTTITQAAKRWIIDDPAPLQARTLPPPTLTADADNAEITLRPGDNYDGNPNVELLVRRGIIAKRATVTRTVTITSDGIKTVFNTVTSTVVSTTSSETTSLSTLTTTTFENAKTTVTVTSTIFLKTTTVTTGPAETVASVPPDANIGTNAPASTGGSSSSSSKKKSGLSTGAKAGIGAAAGVVGLALLAALGAYFWKQHKNKPKVTDDGTGMGMSEVPVGGVGASRLSGAPTETAGSPRFTPSPMTSTIPTGSPVYNTMGPAELGGVAKKPDAEMGSDELMKVSEADGRAVMGHQSGPVDPVYEMPAQNYK